MPKFAWSKIKEGFDPIEEGQYEAIVTDIKNVQKPGKDPYYAVTYTIKDADCDPSYNGRKLFQNVSTAEKALGMLKSYLVATGVALDEDTDVDDLMTESKGASVLLTVGIKEYEEKLNNDVKKVQAA